MSLMQLIYISQPTSALSMTDMVELLERARTANQREAITGLLCFGEGYYLQCLEGDRGRVNTLYRRILGDPRHTQVELLLASDLKTRRFADWAMAYLPLDLSPEGALQRVLYRYTATQRFDPGQLTSETAPLLMEALAAQVSVRKE